MDVLLVPAVGQNHPAVQGLQIAAPGASVNFPASHSTIFTDPRNRGSRVNENRLVFQRCFEKFKFEKWFSKSAAEIDIDSLVCAKLLVH